MPIQLQNVDQAEKLDFPWGELRWLMGEKIQPDTAQTMGLCRIDPGQSNPTHIHPNCEELLYVIAGRCEHVLGDETTIMNVGDLIRIPQGVPHNARCVGDEPMHAIIVFSNGHRQTEML